jgi:exonuclease III
MRLVTWNVGVRVGPRLQQTAALAAAGADILALQEVTARTAPLWRASLADAGLTFSLDALDGLPPKPTRGCLAVLTAPRTDLRHAPAPPMPWPERVLHCALDGIEVINVHSRIARRLSWPRSAPTRRSPLT